ncbi:MAG: aminotransferase class III-fold pyridoxal phosphate-dependent enzyme, partial [Betaproteobacteria bacterium]
LAALEIYQRENLLTRAKQMAPAFETAVHGLRGLPNVIDVRNYGLVAGIELASITGSPGKRAFDVYLKCFERGLLIRTTGDTIALSPSFIIEKSQIDQIIDTVRDVLKTLP